MFELSKPSGISVSLGVGLSVIRRFQRPMDIAMPFIRLNSLADRTIGTLVDMGLLGGRIFELLKAVKKGHRFQASIQLIQVAIRITRIVAAVFQYRAAKIAKTCFTLTTDLTALTQAIRARDLAKIAEIFWSLMRSALSLSLTFIGWAELSLAIEIVNVVIALTGSVRDYQNHRWPEGIAQLAMAGIYIYRAQSPLTLVGERYHGRVPTVG